MSDSRESLREFVEYVDLLEGDEKGEAQVFCDRLFRAFGHAGYKEAGATLEYRIKKRSTGGTSFADLIWPGRLLIEMKKRGTRLPEHLKQAFDYWINAVPNRPRYVVLCNFDEFWIYDFDIQIDEPVDVVAMADLQARSAPLNFLLPVETAPLFGNNRVAVTRDAADKLAKVFNSLVAEGTPRPRARRFVLQILVALFAEDMDLLPAACVAELIRDCKGGQSAYDLFGALFRQMDSSRPADGGRFVGVPYFNGGLFEVIDPCDLSEADLTLLEDAAAQDWAKVNPAIFGTIFEDSMDAEERHAYGAHFTAEADILRVVLPTIVRPWKHRIAAASSLAELVKLRTELASFRVLDPACGSGNFLYVAYRELVRLEVELITKIRREYSLRAFKKHVETVPTVSPAQFFGIDVNEFGVELAKVTLMLAKKLAIEEAIELLEHEQRDLGLFAGDALPLDNLDENFQVGDALFNEWPQVEAIIGNPPYQSKNKIQQELGRAYVNRLRDHMPDVPGRADYCVYWFRRAHDELSRGSRAGLVGTNTIRQNYSRMGGLDYIVGTGGTIIEAVSSQVWSGDAVVHVSIVNWVKGDHTGKKRLFRQVGDNRGSPWEVALLDEINSSLSTEFDVSGAARLPGYATGCYQGQTHGHKSFLLAPEEAERFVALNPAACEVLYPYFIAEELVGQVAPHPRRFVIDFAPRDQLSARQFSNLFDRIEREVLPERKRAAEAENERNAEALLDNPDARLTHHHANFLNRWWQLSYSRQEMLGAIKPLRRYVVCGQVTKRPIFEFVDLTIRPSAALMVFPFDDDYSFGVLQSTLHWRWFVANCSTLKGDPRYTSKTVFETFPWPQSPTASRLKAVARAARALRETRADLMAEHGLSLRAIYKTLDEPGQHPLRDSQETLDRTVERIYGLPRRSDPLAFLLNLNEETARRAAADEAIILPGLPVVTGSIKGLYSADRLVMPAGSPCFD